MAEKRENVDGLIVVNRQRIHTKPFFVSGNAENIGKEEIIRFLNKR